MLGSGTPWYVTEADDRGRRSSTAPARGVREARSRFGGLDVPASLCGMLVAVALFLILGATALAITARIDSNTSRPHLVSVSGGIILVATGAVLLLSFLIGGWAAGRMARYSGALNGGLLAVWFLVLTAVLAYSAHVGVDRWNLSGSLNGVPPGITDWLNAESLGAGPLIAIIVLACVVFAAAVLGGAWGQRMHRRADEVIVSHEDAPTDVAAI
jgi:hypothetical protein